MIRTIKENLVKPRRLDVSPPAREAKAVAMFCLNDDSFRTPRAFQH